MAMALHPALPQVYGHSVEVQLQQPDPKNFKTASLAMLLHLLDACRMYRTPQCETEPASRASLLLSFSSRCGTHYWYTYYDILIALCK